MGNSTLTKNADGTAYVMASSHQMVRLLPLVWLLK